MSNSLRVNEIVVPAGSQVLGALVVTLLVSVCLSLSPSTLVMVYSLLKLGSTVATLIVKLKLSS